MQITNVLNLDRSVAKTTVRVKAPLESNVSGNFISKKPFNNNLQVLLIFRFFFISQFFS